MTLSGGHRLQHGLVEEVGHCKPSFFHKKRGQDNSGKEGLAACSVQPVPDHTPGIPGQAYNSE